MIRILSILFVLSGFVFSFFFSYSASIFIAVSTMTIGAILFRLGNTPKKS